MLSLSLSHSRAKEHPRVQLPLRCPQVKECLQFQLPQQLSARPTQVVGEVDKATWIACNPAVAKEKNKARSTDVEMMDEPGSAVMVYEEDQAQHAVVVVVVNKVDKPESVAVTQEKNKAHI